MEITTQTPEEERAFNNAIREPLSSLGHAFDITHNGCESHTVEIYSDGFTDYSDPEVAEVDPEEDDSPSESSDASVRAAAKPLQDFLKNGNIDRGITNILTDWVGALIKNRVEFGVNPPIKMIPRPNNSNRQAHFDKNRIFEIKFHILKDVNSLASSNPQEVIEPSIRLSGFKNLKHKKSESKTVYSIDKDGTVEPSIFAKGLDFTDLRFNAIGEPIPGTDATHKSSAWVLRASTRPLNAHSVNKEISNYIDNGSDYRYLNSHGENSTVFTQRYSACKIEEKGATPEIVTYYRDMVRGVGVFTILFDKNILIHFEVKHIGLKCLKLLKEVIYSHNIHNASMHLRAIQQKNFYFTINPITNQKIFNNNDAVFYFHFNF